MTMHAQFRFYGELNEFLAPANRHCEVRRHCPADATVKHMIEVFGVPHTEVDWVLANGASVNLAYRMQDGDRVAVHPASVAPDVPSVSRLPDRPLRGERFVADAHLGQLAKRLRILGFDVLYDNHYHDSDIARIAAADGRIVLTRDRGVLIQKAVALGCFLHAKKTDDQVREVLDRCHAWQAVHPFTRCLDCNGSLEEVDKAAIVHRLPERSAQVHEHFKQCAVCGNVYWEGAHMKRMRVWVAQILDHPAIRYGENEGIA